MKLMLRSDYIVVTVLTLLTIIVFCLYFFDPRVIFQRKFNFKLPNTVEIINKAYSLYYDNLELKIKFSEDEYQVILDGFKEYIQSEHLRVVNVKNEEQMFNAETFSKWWSKENEKAVLAYDALPSGRWGARTRVISVLITQNNEGQYFLHVHY